MPLCHRVAPSSCRWLISSLFCCAVAAPATAAEGPIQVKQSDDAITIDTDALQAVVKKKGYVSGIAAGSFIDKKTTVRDLGFGLHIMDFLLAPGWRDGDDYGRDPKLHGNLPKHYGHPTNRN